MQQNFLAPSMMCAAPEDLPATLRLFEEAGIPYLHIDVMDGVFVPNYALGTDYCRHLRTLTQIPLDYHLMITKPEDKLDWFDIREGDLVSVHAESTPHLHRALAAIRQKGAKAFAALNPATPLCVLDYVADEIDGVLLMAVNPGFAAQKMIPSALQKIRDLRAWLDSRGKDAMPIEVDGNVSFENTPLMLAAGANLFVSGSSGVFRAGMPIEENIRTLQQMLK